MTDEERVSDASVHGESDTATEEVGRQVVPVVRSTSQGASDWRNFAWMLVFSVGVLSLALPTAAYVGALTMTGVTLSVEAGSAWRIFAAAAALLVGAMGAVSAPGRWRRVASCACGLVAAMLTWSSVDVSFEVTQAPLPALVWIAVAAHALLFAAWSLAVPLRGLALLAPVLAGIERLVAVTAIPTAALIALRLGLPPTGVASAAIIVSSFVLPLTVVVISRWLGGLRAESRGILTRSG